MESVLHHTWFPDALKHAVEEQLTASLTTRRITAPYFLAAKLDAFADRGRSDAYSSKDMEDVVMVVDGRAELPSERQASEVRLCAYAQEEMGRFLQRPDAEAVVAMHLPSDSASQERAPIVIETL